MKRRNLRKTSAFRLRHVFVPAAHGLLFIFSSSKNKMLTRNHGKYKYIASCEVIRGAITSFIEDVNLIPSDINTRAKEFVLLWTYNSHFKSLFTVKQWVITTG